MLNESVTDLRYYAFFCSFPRLLLFCSSCFIFYAPARLYEPVMEAGDYSYYCREMVVSRTNF
jgi:hypothetical protein